MMTLTSRARPLLALGGLALAALAGAPPAAAQADYSRAERLIGWNLAPHLAGLADAPNWYPDGNRFWYRTNTHDGYEFVRVDPVRNRREPVFDRARLAAAMSLAGDTAYAPNKLPFRSFKFGRDGKDEGTIEFNASRKRFVCDLGVYRCSVGDTLPSEDPYVKSPDRRWEAFIHAHDVYVRPAGGGDSVRLTHDGEELYSYGTGVPRPSAIIEKRPQRPTLQWSPDSRKIAVQRMDERGVERAPLYSATSQRPKLYTYPYALPGDSVMSQFDIYIVDLESRGARKVEHAPHPSPVLGMTGMRDSTWIVVKWSDDSERLYFTHSTRGSKRTQLMVADARGATAPRRLAYDSAATFVELKHGGSNPPNWTVLNRGKDVVWFSQRDGWAHLYRFGPGGELKNQITRGTYVVDEIKHVHDAAGQIFFTARGAESGRHPYFAHLYRVNLDGSGRTLLTPEDAHHEIAFSPDGRFFVDTYSTPTQPPVTVLRSAADGRVLRTLEKVDATRAAAFGWRAPEMFEAKARDGVTNLYGLLHKPSHFDPARKYPIVEYIYPGPQVGSVGNWGWEAGRRGEIEALAELGFIVVQLDHMGTPWRSKAFHDAYYGNMADHGLPDHVAVLKQLAARHPWMDLTRVGIYGHSGGGFASTAAILQYPDFYKVAVSSAGNHDNRSYGSYWGEKYQGLLARDTLRKTDNFESQANSRLAANLRGKLLLMHGDMDDNVHPAMTMQVVDALIKANKTFDLLILPNRYHGLSEPYVIRRRWDYFVEHLLGEAPPRDFKITRPAA